MDILQGESIRGTFFCIEAYGNSLYCADVIYRALLVKIGKSNMAVLFINFNWRDGGRDFLYQRQSFLKILLIGAVNQIFQRGAAKPPGIPGCHR